MKRRHFLQLAAAATAGTFSERSFALSPSSEHIKLCIERTSVELAPDIVLETTAYNGQVPGPVLRMREGIPATVAVTNRTAQTESMQWYGLPGGSAELLEQVVAPGITQIYQLAPLISGTRWYRSCNGASTCSEGATGEGRFGFLIVSPRNEKGAYDQEVLLAIRHWDARLGGSQSVPYASFNDKLLGAGEPIRVRHGQRVLFRFLNASAKQETLLHLPGHRFEVVALDGSPVANRTPLNVLSLAPGERIDAVVAMNSPGKWILGSTKDAERSRGLGIHIEYANQSGDPRWLAPEAMDWSYARFSTAKGLVPQHRKTSSVLLERSPKFRNGFQWTFNGRAFPDLGSLPVSYDSGLLLKMMNATEVSHSVHLPHHNFLLARVHQIPVAGVKKDTLHLERYSVIEADVIPT